MQPGKTKNQNRPLRTYRTYPPDARRERGWAGGKRSQSQNAELSMQVREPRMDNNRASAADNLRKFLRAASAVRNFSPLLSRTKNTIFVSFTAFSQRKLLLINIFVISLAGSKRAKKCLILQGSPERGNHVTERIFEEQ